MKRRRKRRASPAPLICLLAVLACIVALRISVSEEAAASAQMTGKLENPATTAPVRLLEAEMTEAEQVTRAEDRPARAARYVNIEMTDEELAVYKRGRNAKPKTAPAHATLAEYARSTGLEALFGMLYLTGQSQRILELWQIVLQSGQGEMP